MVGNLFYGELYFTAYPKKVQVHFGQDNSYHINVRKRLEDLIDKAEDLRYSNILIQKLICNELQTIRKELLSGFLKIHN